MVMESWTSTPMDTDQRIMDDVVGGKFKIGRIIGSGSFGELHEGVDIESGEKVAIKLEPVDTGYPLLMHESDMYKRLAGGPGIPNLKWFGVEGKHNIMVIDLLGRSLADLLDRCDGKFTLKTVLMLAAQLIDTLEYIHSRGVVHRDIKPGNLLMGSHRNAHRVYLVDFGLAGYYKDPDTDEHIRYREDKGFMGTYRYASMFTHYGIEQSRRDDLGSLGYVLLYLLNGRLPWQGLSAGKDPLEYNKLLFYKKYETSFEELCELNSYPLGFETYLLYCQSLKFNEDPEYDFLRRILVYDLERMECELDYIYDWSTPQKDSKKARRKRNKRNKNKKKDNNLGGGQPQSQKSIGQGNVGHTAPPFPTVFSSMLPEFINLSIGSTSTSRAVATGPVTQQLPLQQSPVPAPLAPVQPAQQQVAAAPPSQKTVPVAPSSSRLIKAPARNGYGSIGKKCVIGANHFLVDFGQKDPHQYDDKVGAMI